MFHSVCSPWALLRRTASRGPSIGTFNIRCACDKDPSSEQCQLYKRNKSMYDGNGLQPGWNPATPNRAAAAVRTAAPPVVPQDRTPVSPTLLPAETPFWQALPAGTRIAIGVRPQWLSASPLFDQLLSLGGQATGQKMSVDAVKRELAGRGYGDYRHHANGGSLL